MTTPDNPTAGQDEAAVTEATLEEAVGTVFAEPEVDDGAEPVAEKAPEAAVAADDKAKPAEPAKPAFNPADYGLDPDQFGKCQSIEEALRLQAVQYRELRRHMDSTRRVEDKPAAPAAAPPAESSRPNLAEMRKFRAWQQRDPDAAQAFYDAQEPESVERWERLATEEEAEERAEKAAERVAARQKPVPSGDPDELPVEIRVEFEVFKSTHADWRQFAAEMKKIAESDLSFGVPYGDLYDLAKMPDVERASTLALMRAAGSNGMTVADAAMLAKRPEVERAEIIGLMQQDGMNSARAVELVDLRRGNGAGERVRGRIAATKSAAAPGAGRTGTPVDVADMSMEDAAAEVFSETS